MDYKIIVPETTINENNEDDEEVKFEPKKFIISKNQDSYIFTCSKTKNSLLLEIKLDKLLNNYYYQKELFQGNLIKISKVFSFCDNIEESYELLIDNLIKYEDELKIDILDNNLKLSFSLELPTKKIDNVNIIMNRKENKIENELNDISKNLLDLNSRIDLLQNNHNEVEKEIKLEQKGINSITEKQNHLEKELQNTVKEIEEIKSFQLKLENIYKENEKKILKLVKNQDDILSEIENIKKGENQNNNEQYNINRILKSIPEINKELELLKINQVEIQDILKEKNNDKNKEFKKDDFIDQIMEEIEELKNENKLMKKRLNDSEKKLDDFNVSFKKEIDEIKHEKIDPKEFEFKKTISNDLFSRNFYNNRACIFSSYQDDNIYVAYGIKTNLDLEGYDVLNDEKFIIIKSLHKNFFDSCRYYFDDIKNRDLLITTSLDSHVKVINFIRKKSEVILDLNFESVKDAIINTAYFIHENILIPFAKEGVFKFYSIFSDYIGEIKGAGFILGLNKFFLEKNKCHYILISNTEGVFVYCIETFSLYHKFIPLIDKKGEEKEKEKSNSFGEAFIIEKDKTILLIAPCFNYGYLFIWDFEEGNLIKAIETASGISDICLWDNKYIFASLVNDQCQFVLINIKNMKIEKEFEGIGNEYYGNGIKVLRNDLKGNYLISLSLKGKLDLYTIDNE